MGTIEKLIRGREKTAVTSLSRLQAEQMLLLWRKKYAHKLRGLDAVKAIRELREGKYR